MDITLSDIGWIGGGLLLLTALSILFTHRAEIAQALWSSRAGSGIHRAGSGTGSDGPVPRQQHQAAPELVLDFQAVLDYLKRHNLTDEQVIDVYAVTHREQDYPLSANKIRDVVGGNEKDVKARVAGHRPKPVQPRPQARLLRPEGGW